MQHSAEYDGLDSLLLGSPRAGFSPWVPIQKFFNLTVRPLFFPFLPFHAVSLLRTVKFTFAEADACKNYEPVDNVSSTLLNMMDWTLFCWGA